MAKQSLAEFYAEVQARKAVEQQAAAEQQEKQAMMEQMNAPPPPQAGPPPGGPPQAMMQPPPPQAGPPPGGPPMDPAAMAGGPPPQAPPPQAPPPQAPPPPMGGPPAGPGAVQPPPPQEAMIPPREGEPDVTGWNPIQRGVAGGVRGLQKAAMGLGNKMGLPGYGDETVGEANDKMAHFDQNKGTAGNVGEQVANVALAAGGGLAGRGVVGSAGTVAAGVGNVGSRLKKALDAGSAAKMYKGAKKLKKGVDKFNKNQLDTELGIKLGKKLAKGSKRDLQRSEKVLDDDTLKLIKDLAKAGYDFTL